jgi:hypothetical protein
MSQKIKIYTILFLMLVFSTNESFCLSQKTIVAQDSIIILEDDAEIAFDNAKFYYQKAEQSLYNNKLFSIFQGLSIFHFFSYYRKAEENSSDAITFYKAVGDKEKLIALMDMSKKIERMYIIMISLILLQFASLSFSFFRIFSALGVPISFVTPAAATFLLLYIIAEPVLFKTKKIVKKGD